MEEPPEGGEGITEEPQEEVDGDLQLVPFEHAGVKYLKDDENYLYDPETEEEVGFWNGSEVEELEAPLVPFEHAGVKYLKDDENYLYDPETEEEVGFWNGSEV